MQSPSAPKIRFLLLRFLLNLVTHISDISELRDNWVSFVTKLISSRSHKISDKIDETVIKEFSYEHPVCAEQTALQNLHGGGTTQAVL